MYIIKRYPNRKLYDTIKNKYINLVEISDLIRQGEEISVIDNVSGEDITTFTLTQIIMDKEKRDGNFIPRSILLNLIKAGGESISFIWKKIIPSSELIQQVDEEITQRLQNLILRGELAEDLAKKIQSKLFNEGFFQKKATFSVEEIQESLKQQNILNRGDFELLVNKLNQISEKLDIYSTMKEKE